MGKPAEHFDDDLLSVYAEAFFGYGSYAAPYWFVGMEEGGGDDFAEVDAKLRIWDRRGRRELEDLAAFHHEVGISQWFGPQARIQPTWSKYVRIILTARGYEPTTDQIRCYQSDELGQPHSQSCLIELLPLPSPSIRHWHYSERSQLPQLASRKAYQAYYGPKRAAHLRERIRAQAPRAVIFTSVNPRYRKWWEEIAGAPFDQQMFAGKSCYTSIAGPTRYIAMQHPVAWGLTEAYFHAIAAFVAAP